MSEKSRSWDARCICVPGMQIPGWPFSEGVPRARFGEYEIILRNGERHVATLNFSTQYQADGIQWQVGRMAFPKINVACWRTKPTEPSPA